MGLRTGGDSTTASAQRGGIQDLIQRTNVLEIVGDMISGLVKMTGFELGKENVVGVRLPILMRIELSAADYSLLQRESTMQGSAAP